MTFGRRFVAAAVAVPLLVVGGCADDPKPKVAPPSQTPTSASPTATPTPEPWEKKTNAGAVAFAKHWIDVFNEAQGSGETNALRALSEPNCGSCDNFATYLEDVYAEGGRFVSDGWRVEETAQTVRLQDSAMPRVALRIKQSPEIVHRGGSGKVERFPGGMVSYSATLEWVADGWRMSRLDLVT